MNDANPHHRSEEVLARMMENFRPPERIDDVVSDTLLEELNAIEAATEPKQHKRGGVINTVASAVNRHPAIMDLVNRFVGSDACIDYSLFFSTPIPYFVHTDAGKQADHVPLRVMLIPLALEPEEGESATVIFHQRWPGLSANFERGRPEHKTEFNLTVTDYTGMIGISNEPFPEDFRVRHISHIPVGNLEGLSPEAVLPWKRGSVLLFDRAQLHCSENFWQTGVTRKRGLTITTRLR